MLIANFEVAQSRAELDWCAENGISFFQPIEKVKYLCIISRIQLWSRESDFCVRMSDFTAEVNMFRA